MALGLYFCRCGVIDVMCDCVVFPDEQRNAFEAALAQVAAGLGLYLFSVLSVSGVVVAVMCALSR